MWVELDMVEFIFHGKHSRYISLKAIFFSEDVGFLPLSLSNAGVQTLLLCYHVIDNWYLTCIISWIVGFFTTRARMVTNAVQHRRCNECRTGTYPSPWSWRCHPFRSSGHSLFSWEEIRSSSRHVSQVMRTISATNPRNSKNPEIVLCILIYNAYY